MNLLDNLSVFVFACPEVRVLVFCFCFHLTMYRYRLIYFPDLHCPGQVKNPMFRQNYKMSRLLASFHFFSLMLYGSANQANIFSIKSNRRNMILSMVILRQLFPGLSHMLFIIKTDIIEICNLFTSKKEPIFTCSHMSIIYIHIYLHLYIYIYIYIYTLIGKKP